MIQRESHPAIPAQGAQTAPRIAVRCRSAAGPSAAGARATRTTPTDRPTPRRTGTTPRAPGRPLHSPPSLTSACRAGAPAGSGRGLTRPLARPATPAIAPSFVDRNVENVLGFGASAASGGGVVAAGRRRRTLQCCGRSTGRAAGLAWRSSARASARRHGVPIRFYGERSDREAPLELQEARGSPVSPDLPRENQTFSRSRTEIPSGPGSRPWT